MTMYPKEGLRRDKQCLDALVEPGQGGRELIGRRYENGKNVDPKLTRGKLSFGPRRFPDGIRWVPQSRDVL